MNELILNDRIIRTDRPAGITLLDFIRYEQHLRGTKIGCREGDCGACTVLVGKLDGDSVSYQSITSCISPLGNAFGKHIVTVEGLKVENGLSPVQSALVEEGGTQCGFCTPGFAVSLTGYCLSCEHPGQTAAVAAVDGNICRCTGYKSIERSIARVVSDLTGNAGIDQLVSSGFIPEYFLGIAVRLVELRNKKQAPKNITVAVGGGTDLYVQRPKEIAGANVQLLGERRGFKGIRVKGNTCKLGGSTTATDLLESEEMNQIFPNLPRHLKLVSSTQIRNMGTIAGNFVNASPIGDLSIFFLALDATINLKSENSGNRSLPLRKFYKGYKKLDKKQNELIETIEFSTPDSRTQFNFEKVCKRTHLDIASVNSAIQITLDKEDRIETVHLSAGGIGPIPMYLTKTAKTLTGESLSPDTVKNAAQTMAKEISPISDARGTAEYKSLLLRQLFYAHFLELFPEHFTLADLI